MAGRAPHCLRHESGRSRTLCKRAGIVRLPPTRLQFLPRCRHQGQRFHQRVHRIDPARPRPAHRTLHLAPPGKLLRAHRAERPARCRKDVLRVAGRTEPVHASARHHRTARLAAHGVRISHRSGHAGFYKRAVQRRRGGNRIGRTPRLHQCFQRPALSRRRVSCSCHYPDWLRPYFRAGRHHRCHRF